MHAIGTPSLGVLLAFSTAVWSSPSWPGGGSRLRQTAPTLANRSGAQRLLEHVFPISSLHLSYVSAFFDFVGHIVFSFSLPHFSSTSHPQPRHLIHPPCTSFRQPSPAVPCIMVPSTCTLVHILHGTISLEHSHTTLRMASFSPLCRVFRRGNCCSIRIGNFV